MSDEQLILGLDIGGTKSAVILGDRTGRVHARRTMPSRAARGPQAMIDDLCGMAGELGGEAGGIERIAAVGVSIGGPMDADQGIILSPPNLPGWDAVPLREILAQRLGRPVRIEHDAAACCLAEYYWGAGQGASRVAYLTCGTGFGAGVVLSGKAYYGAKGRSIEIGHVRYQDDGPVAFGKAGSFEAFGAGASLPKLAAWRFPQRWGQNPPEGKALSQLAKSGDDDAGEILRLNASAVGAACALLGDLIGPDVIVLGSLAQYLGESWTAQVRQRFDQECLPAVAHDCRIVPAGLGARLQDCSALAAARGLVG